MATFGNQTATDNYWTGHGTNQKVGGKFTLSVDGDVSSISVRLCNTEVGHAACYAKALIYSDVGGTPTSLLGTSSAKAIADNAVYAWVEFTFASAVALDAGNYWLCYFGDDTADGVALSNDGDAGGNTQYNNDTYSDGPEATWTVEQARTYTFDIYATYTASVSAKGHTSLVQFGIC